GVSVRAEGGVGRQRTLGDGSGKGEARHPAGHKGDLRAEWSSDSQGSPTEGRPQAVLRRVGPTRKGQGRNGPVQSAPGRGHRKTLQRTGHEPPGSGPGRQYRPDESGGTIRPPAWVRVQVLRDVAVPSWDQLRPGGSGA